MAEILSVLVIQEFDNVVVFDNVVEFNNSLKFYAFKHKLINKCDFNCKICIIKKITSNIDVIYRRIHFATVFFFTVVDFDNGKLSNSTISCLQYF